MQGATQGYVTSAGSSPEKPAVVLDTNATLDWLVFADPGMATLAASIQARTVRWLACHRMRDELARTLSYPALARWTPDADAVLDAFDLWAQVHPHPATAPQGLRCADPDDQVFVDLAVVCRARWLVSHDRAVRRLSKAARAHGVWIGPPSLWRP